MDNLFESRLRPRQPNPSSVGHLLSRAAAVRPNECRAIGIIWPRIQVISHGGLPKGRESASASASTHALCGTIRSCAPSAAPHMVRRDGSKKFQAEQGIRKRRANVMMNVARMRIE